LLSRIVSSPNVAKLRAKIASSIALTKEVQQKRAVCSDTRHLHTRLNKVRCTILRRQAISKHRLAPRAHHTASKALVSTDVSWPDVDEFSFLLSLTTSTSTRIDGQCDAGATCDAKLSVPSARSPRNQRTKPPYRLRHALPDPTLTRGHVST
jgi:hypothetical protein